ncbi:MAG TPA: ATP synthase F1 subunit delta [Methylomirabilota bacterium]|nr:ATP synthase F1 subunit delta [Methylomirabilota bacterium]
MIKDASLAARYARALQILTEKQAAKSGRAPIPILEQSLEELQGLAKLLAHGTRLGKFVLDPQVSPLDRRRVLENGLRDRVLPSVRVFADLLLRKKRVALLEAIAHEFQAIVERAKGLERATVVSAVRLTDGERDRLHRELERFTGKKIVLESLIDAALVGGAYVRIGDRVIDRSVKSLLGSLAQQLYEVSV